MKNRVIGLDIARALCMLYIVGFWHMDDYIGVGWNSPIGEGFTSGVLGMFTFISGFFMGKVKINNKEDIIHFFQWRLLKIYPPFFIVCIVMYISSVYFNQMFFENSTQLLLTISGLSCFIPPMAMTVWYVSMLLVFYLLTPGILFFHAWKKALVGSLIMVIFTISVYMGNGDERLILYFPAYFLGILFSKTSVINEDKVNLKMLILSLVVFALAVNLYADTPNMVIRIIFTYSFIFLFREVSVLLVKLGINGLWEWLSYNAMVAYLIHRLYYGAIQKIMGGWIRPVWAYLFVLPSLLVLSFIIQKIYDKLLLFFKKYVAEKCKRNWDSC